IMTTKAQQIELDNALVAPENRRVIGKCNMRINPGMNPKEALSFIRELGHTGEIKYITDVIIDHLHQLWRTFASIINKCLRGKKKSAKAKKVAAPKPKPTKKKTLVKAEKGKGLNVLSEVALSEAAQLKEVTKRSKKDFHISHASGSSDGTDFKSGVPDEQHCKTSGTDERTGIKPGIPDVPKYDSESEKEYWGNSGEEDNDDENDSKDESDNGDNEDDGDDDEDGNNDDKQEDDDNNNDEEVADSDRSESDRIEILVLNQSTIEYYKEEEEKDDDEEKMDDEVTKELYDDVNVNFGNRDTEMTDADQGGSEQQNVSQELGFEQVEEDAHVTLTLILDIQKADEPVQSSSVSSDFTSKLLNLQNASPADNEIASLTETSARHAMAVPEITSFNNRVTNLEKDLSEIKQVDQYAQALSSIPAIVNHYINNKLRDAINKVIQAHNLDCRQEAQDKKNKSSSQPQSTYEAAAALFEFELTKILIDKMEKNKSYNKADHKRELYDALVKSYQSDKELFDTYGEVFTLKRSQDDRDKDQNPSAGSDRETKRRKLSNEAELSKDSRSKEKKYSSTSKDTSHSQQKPSGKSAHAEEPIHTVDDSRVQQD
ncbi:hypothetical protein Tco_1181017, partial [Tanacetum coccineum]